MLMNVLSTVCEKLTCGPCFGETRTRKKRNPCLFSKATRRCKGLKYARLCRVIIIEHSLQNNIEVLKQTIVTIYIYVFIYIYIYRHSNHAVLCHGRSALERNDKEALREAISECQELQLADDLIGGRDRWGSGCPMCGSIGWENHGKSISKMKVLMGKASNQIFPNLCEITRGEQIGG